MTGARRTWFHGSQLALILVLAAAAVASAVVPWVLSSQPGIGTQPPVAGSPTSAVVPPTATPTVTPTPTPTATADPTVSPTHGGGPPTSRPPAPPVFVPISVEAEDPDNVPPAGAEVTACVQCSGGYRLRYVTGPVGLIVPLTIPVAGTRSITVVYETDSPRTLVVTVNRAVVYNRTVVGPSWDVPSSVTFRAYLPAGTVLLALDSDTSSGPDLDKVTITTG